MEKLYDRPQSIKTESEHNQENQFTIEDLSLSKDMHASDKLIEIGSINQNEEEDLNPTIGDVEHMSAHSKEGRLLFEEQQMTAEAEPLRMTSKFENENI